MEEMKELSSPQALLQKHLDAKPEILIVASISGNGRIVTFDASAPAPMADLFFLHKLLEHKLNHSLEMSIRGVFEEGKSK